MSYEELNIDDILNDVIPSAPVAVAPAPISAPAPAPIPIIKPAPAPVPKTVAPKKPSTGRPVGRPKGSTKPPEKKFSEIPVPHSAREAKAENRRLKNSMTLTGAPLEVSYTPAQDKIFSDPHRYIVLAKGRRFGGTRGAMHYAVEQMLSGKRVLWVDTIQANLGRYYERYAVPVLNNIKKEFWTWNEQKKVLKVGQGYMDMRSAERPENLEGFAYDIIILNEAGIILNDNYLWNNAIRPMVMDYRAKCFFIGTPKGKRNRNGEEHMFYTFFKRGSPNEPDYKEDWYSYRYSSYDNPLLDRKEIESLEAEVPYHIRSQEIQAEFIDEAVDAIFREVWWQYVDAVPSPPNIQMKILSLDTAFKEKTTNDFTAGTIWYRTSSAYYLENILEERLAFPDLIDKIRLLHTKYNFDAIVIEDKASGQSLIQMFQRTTLPVVPFKVDTDKVTRACAITPLIEQGKVFLVKGFWNKHYTDYMAAFPNGEFDDLVDSTSQALSYLKLPAEMTNRPIYGRASTLTTRKIVGYD